MTVVRSVFEARPRLPDASGLIARARLATRRRPSWWRDEWDEQVLFLAVALSWTVWTWKRDQQVKQRLADVTVPNGVAVIVLCFVLSRQRTRNQAWHQASASLSEMSRALTAQRLEQIPPHQALPEVQPSAELQERVHSLARQESEHDGHLVALTQQIVQLNTWFARIMVAAAIIVVATVAIWAASR